MTFQERREKHRNKRKRTEGRGVYSWRDFLWDGLFYFPELLLWPFRMLWWGLKTVTRVFNW